MERGCAQRPAGEAGPRVDRHWLNAERVRVYSWMIVVIFGIGTAIWTALSLPDLVAPNGKPVGYDFMAYWSAAQLALLGQLPAAFDEVTLAAVQHAAAPSSPDIVFPWHYPPIFMLPVAPLGLLPYAAALAVFVAGTALLWAALVRRVLPDPSAWIVAAAAPAGLINLLDGQNAFLTAALAGFALLWLDRRPIAAGVLIGLLAIKPHLAVLFPIALLAEARWRTISAAAVTGLSLAAASLIAFGWDSWAAFFDHLPITQAMAERGAVPWGTMPSGYVFALSLGLPVRAAWVLQAAAALFAAACVWRAWRNRGALLEAKRATLIAGSLLVSPYLFYYDLLWAALAIGWLLPLCLHGGFRRGEREVFLLAFLAPILMQPIQMLTGIQVGFPAVVLLLFVAARQAAPLGDADRHCLRRAVGTLREARWASRERLLRWGVGFALMALAATMFSVVSRTANGLTDAAGRQLGEDFVNYYAGARLAANGLASRVYDVPWFQAFQQTITGPASEFKFYGYPPITMLLSLPLAWFSFVPALILWAAIGTAWCFELLRRQIGRQAAAVALIGAPAALLNLLGGQNGCFTAALMAGGLMAIDRRPVLAGVCFGCLSYKPQLGILLPVALVAGARWRAFVAAGLTVGLLMAVSVALFGTETWAGFADQIALQRRMMEIATDFWHRMPTIFAAARLIGVPIAAAYAAQLTSGLLAAVAVAAIWRSGASSEVKAASLSIAAFLTTPYAWDYDAVILIFAAAWLAREAMRDRFLPYERIAVVALLGWLMPAMAIAVFCKIQFGPVVLWAVLLLLLRRCFRERFAIAAAAVRHFCRALVYRIVPDRVG